MSGQAVIAALYICPNILAHVIPVAASISSPHRRASHTLLRPSPSATERARTPGSSLDACLASQAFGSVPDTNSGTPQRASHTLAASSNCLTVIVIPFACTSI
jgi:hypothetical protein